MQQKSGAAILLFRSSRLWYCPLIRTNNTEPTPVYKYIYTLCAYRIYTPMSIFVLLCFGLYEFTRFWRAKTKRVRRFSICLEMRRISNRVQNYYFFLIYANISFRKIQKRLFWCTLPNLSYRFRVLRSRLSIARMPPFSILSYTCLPPVTHTFTTTQTLNLI